MRLISTWTSPERLPWSLMLIGVFIGGLLWLVTLIPSGTTQVTDTYQDSALSIIVDPGRVTRPGDCFAMRWDTTDIREIRINGEATIGAGSENICDVGEVRRFEIIFPNGAAREYTVTFPYTTGLPGFALITIFAAICFTAGLSAIAARLVSRVRFSLPSPIALVLGIALIVGVWGWAQVPSPAALTDTQDGASVNFELDRTRHLWLRTCYTANWSADGIRAVFLNGNPRIGEGNETVCSHQRATPTLAVDFENDTTQTYTLPLTYTLLNPLGLIATTLGLGLVILGGVGLLQQIVSARATVALIAGPLVGLVIYAAITYMVAVISGPLMPTTLRWFLLFSVVIGIGVGWWLPLTGDSPYRFGVGALVPFVVLLPALVAQFFSVQTQLGADGHIHTTMAYSVMSGGITPENPWLAGVTSQFYWHYHSLIAALMSTFQLTPPGAAYILTLFASISGVFWSLVFVREITQDAPLAPIQQGVLAVLMLFGGNLLGAA
ncbi:MAG: hypothetical protein AAF125_07520, partial [Chloroflexota bacterium]